MTITKTNFINYTRCDRYVSLEELKNDVLNSEKSLEDYLKDEEKSQYKEIASTMFRSDKDGLIDTTVKIDNKLNSMLDYYKEVELIAGKEAELLFSSPCKYSKETYNEESFSFSKNGLKYICFVDIYNETDNEINIVEVKSSTSSKYKDLSYSIDKNKFPLFIKEDNVYKLSKKPPVSKSYDKCISKLLNRFEDTGKYVYDLAVQRYFIEGYLKENNLNKKVNYYLAFLNNEYTYDGYTEHNKRVYKPDSKGNKIIEFFCMNEITKLYLPLIDNERITLETHIFEDYTVTPHVGEYCALNKSTECIYKNICFKNVPSKNSSFNYKKFTKFDDGKIKYNKYDLVNKGILKLDDVPISWLKNPNHIIQRDCYDNNKVYINKDKIASGLNSLSYPIYHLDFETFQCPLPRFKGEHPFTQSPFEFSLHIESAPGVCDFDLDNFVFLATSNKDERRELVKALVSHIPIEKTGGCILAQNVNFEKDRLKELAEIFPEYKKELLKMRESGRDLLEIIDTNKKLYTSLGYSIEDASTMNYYSTEQSGSFSIKKTLPLFTNLSYKDLEVQNGVEAQIEYSRFDTLSEEELNRSRSALIDYCKQDTWAMVQILKGLRKEIE